MVGYPQGTGGSDDSSATIAVGAKVDRYEIEGVLGAGGMGAVYAARDPRLGRTVAIKVLRWTDGTARHRLMREAQTMAKISHPAVVTVFDVGELGEDVYVAMEHVRGGTLRDWMQTARPWRDVIAMMVSAGRGLAAAHAAGIVHRDFKPENVLVDDAGRPRVSDFGLARVESRNEQAVANGITVTTFAGTPAYMAPEQHQGRGVDARSDQFSFCVTCWEALYGVRPFQPVQIDGAETTAGLAVAVTTGRVAEPPAGSVRHRALVATLRRGLAVDPSARWPDMAALLGQLERIVRLRSRWWVASAGALALTAAGAFVMTRSTVDQPRAAAFPPPSCQNSNVETVWNASAREAYLRVAPAAAAEARSDVIWFDAYAAELTSAYKATCAASVPAGPKLECLDGALEDLRAALVRQERTRWARLRTIDRCGAAPSKVAHDLGKASPHGEMIRISPDGRRVVTQSNGSEPVIRDVTANETTPLVGVTEAIRWLPDGTLAARDKKTNGLLIVDPETGTITRRFPHEGPVLDVSPGLRVVALRRGERGARAVAIVALAGETPAAWTRLNLPLASGARSWTFSPDERRFALVDQREIRIVDLETATISTIPFRAGVPSGLLALHWLDNATILVNGVVSRQARSDIWRIRLDSRGQAETPQVLVPGDPETELLVQDVQGARLAIHAIRSESQVAVVDGQGTTYLSGVMTSFTFISATPDGKRILARGPDAKWYRIDTDTWTSTNLGLQAQSWSAHYLGDSIVGIARSGYYEATDAGRELASVPLGPEIAQGHVFRCDGSGCALGWIEGRELVLGRIDARGLGPLRRIPVDSSTLAGFDFSPTLERVVVFRQFSTEFVLHTAGTMRVMRVADAQSCTSGRLLASSLLVRCQYTNGDSALLELALGPGDRPPQVRVRGLPFIGSYLPLGSDRLLVSTLSFAISVQLLDLE